ncbi:MAG: type VI secretion system lipoprotein TssJ [Desulfomonilia bacterium]|nr:type VI secretion system lipoprotein TssJ [Desulfomonilia bacterium]
MRSIKTIVVLISVLPLLVACAAATRPAWEYEENAITLLIEADNQLNMRDGKAFTLSLCLYQLKDPNAFLQLASDVDGLYKLLDCGVFDASVAMSKRLIIHPGQNLKGVLNRAEGAKYVAVVAGYYTVEKDRIVRFYKIPVAKKGLFQKKMVPQHLEVQLKLGAQQIMGSPGE